MFTGQVPVGGTDAEGGGEGEVGEMIVFGDFLDEGARGSGVGDAFAQEAMEDGAAGILRLQVVLEIERFKNVVRESYGEMGRISVVGFGVFHFHIRGVCNFDIGIFFLVEKSESVGGAFGGSCFQIVEIVGFFLIGSYSFAHMSEHFFGEFLTRFGRDGGLQEVFDRFVRAHESNGGEMVFPVLPESFSDIAEVELGIGIESLFGELLDDFSFYLEAFLGDIHQAIETLEEIFFIFGEVADSREIHGDDADRAGQGVRAKESAAALSELAIIETKPTTHTSRVVGAHIGIDEVREIGDAVFGGHFPERLIRGILPVKIFGDIVGWNGEGEDASRGVALAHHFREGAIDHCHFGGEFTIRFFLGFAADDDVFVCQNFRRNHIHRNVGEGRLESDSRRNIHIEHEGLDLLFHLRVGKFVSPDKGRQERIEIGERLRARHFALERVDEVDHLSQDRTQMFGRLAGNLARDAGKAAPQEIFQIPAAAVGGNELEVVNMKVARLVRVADFFGIDRIHPILGADGARDIVVKSLEGIRHIGILLDEPVEISDVLVDQMHGFDK